MMDGSESETNSSPPSIPSVYALSPPDSIASDQPDEQLSPKLWFDWNDRDQRVLLVLTLLVLVGIGWHWFQWRLRGVELVEIRRLPARQYDFQVDINHATWVEWMQLPGVGEILARQIVADREQRGPFQQVVDLKRVKGVGTVTFDTIQPWLICSDGKIGTAH